MFRLLVVISRWLKGKVQPDGAHPSPSRTRGCLIHRGTLPPIWPLSSKYENIHPVIGVSWRAGAAYSFPYRPKGPARTRSGRGEKTRQTEEVRNGQAWSSPSPREFTKFQRAVENKENRSKLVMVPQRPSRLRDDDDGEWDDQLSLICHPWKTLQLLSAGILAKVQLW